MEKMANFGAFVDKFILQSSSSSQELPLSGLTFAVKDIFDVNGYVTGFGSPDWARTHAVATSTAPVVLAVLKNGASCVGKTVMDEMAYSIDGENKHYGTPRNPCAPDRVPGGSSSGSAVAVAATLVDFSLGTDTGGSVRVPASYCGILGFRPSHGAVSTEGVIPMAQSFDTVGWFARNPVILSKVGRVLLDLPDVDHTKPAQILIAEDCFNLSSIPTDRSVQALVESVKKLLGVRNSALNCCVCLRSSKHDYKAVSYWFRIGDIVKHVILGDYVKERVPSLKHFMTADVKDQVYNIPSLAALSAAMRLLQRYEFKNNHADWVTKVNPDLGPGIHERVWDAIRTAEGHRDDCHLVKSEFSAALSALLTDCSILVLPTVPGPPPKLQEDPTASEVFRARAFSLLSIAGVSGFCQVSIPVGMHDNLPISISLLANRGSDAFLLSVVETLYETVKEQTGS